MASIENKEKNGGIGLFWTLFVVGIYMVIGPALILLNKFILHNLNFQYPMFLSGLGVLVSGIVARLLVGCGYVTLQRKDAVEGLLWYRRVLPVGLAHAGTLAFGNSVYLLLNVGFIQMLKSFTPVIIMLTAYLARIETPTRPVVSSVLVISLGTAMTCSFTPQVEDRTGQDRTLHPSIIHPFTQTPHSCTSPSAPCTNLWHFSCRCWVCLPCSWHQASYFLTVHHSPTLTLSLSVR